MFKYKVCTGCHTILLATTDNFHKKKDGKHGLNAKCKKCRKEYQKEYRKTDKCKEYYKEYKKTDRYKEYQQEYKKEYRKTDKYKEYQQEYQKTDRYKEYQQEYHKEYRKTDKRKECQKKYNKEYRKTDKGQVATFNGQSKRRTKIANNGGEITKDQWLECMNFFNWTCAYSGEKLTNDTRSLDHIESIAQGGSNNIWNVVPMLRSLNSSKRDKHFLEWFQEQPFFSKERLAKIYEWIEYSKNKYENMEVKNVY